MSRVLVFRPACAGQWTAFLLPSVLTLLATGYRPALLTAAPSKAEREQEATVLVTHALDAEAEGKTTDRNELLQWALEKVPDFAPALWHSGFVRFENKWTKADDIPHASKVQKDLVAYDEQRDQSPQTASGQLRLVNWCAAHKLFEQERAHLTRVLDADPNNAMARKRLHFVMLDGIWRSQEEVRAAAAQADRIAASIKKWSLRLKQAQRMLDQTDGHSAGAAKRLRAIQDPDAIPAMEQSLANLNEASARLLVDILSKMKSPDASLALARVAVTSAWVSVREEAAENLKTRSDDDYVPALLSALSTPILAKMELYQAWDGRLIYNHAFYSEAQDHRELSGYQTAFQRGWQSDYNSETIPLAPTQRSSNGRLNTAVTHFDVKTTTASEPNAGKAIGMAQQTAVAREAIRESANRRIDEQNRRVCEVLAISTGKDLPASPEAWWDWWKDHNEVVTDGDKPLQQSFEANQVLVNDSPGFVNNRPGTSIVVTPVPTMPAVLTMPAPSPVVRSSYFPSNTPHSCLAAGTPIWTAAGSRYVDQIKPGDLVLSQNPDTGELSYKPVLATTFNKGAKIFKMRVGQDEIRSTGGHTFWVDRRGWVRVRQLETAARLHAVAGATAVEEVEATGVMAPVFNLIVADFHTYFVGKERVLSHDITPRKAVDATPLGLLGSRK